MDGSRRSESRKSGVPGEVSWHAFLGAHMSIAGGLNRALEAAAKRRSGAAQMFTRNANQWVAKPLDRDSVRLFIDTAARLGPFRLAAHDSYLINLGSPSAELRAKSLRSFIEEIERCEALSIPYLVFHPGAHMGEGETAGLKRITRSIRSALRSTQGFETALLIENTAGQGSCLGYDLDHLRVLLEGAGDPHRTGVCLDTCHLFAAGYDFRAPQQYQDLRGEIDRRLGIPAVRWFHVNDSKGDLGSRIDRHHHIGRGRIGSRPFRYFLTDPAFRRVPMVIETPKENEMDRWNLAHLRRLSRMNGAALTAGGTSCRLRGEADGRRLRGGIS